MPVWGRPATPGRRVTHRTPGGPAGGTRTGRFLRGRTRREVRRRQGGDIPALPFPRELVEAGFAAVNGAMPDVDDLSVRDALVRLLQWVSGRTPAG